MHDFETNVWKVNRLQSQAARRASRARILVVDDSDLSRELVREALDDERYEVWEAANGRAALDILARAMPDLIILDIQMPLMDGYETLQAIRLNHKLRGIPVMAVTAYAMLEDRQKALAAGFSEFLAKPLKISTLCDSIERLLKQ